MEKQTDFDLAITDDKEAELEDKRQDYERKCDVNAIGQFLLRSLKGKESFTEKVPLNIDGTINIESTSDIGRSTFVRDAKTIDTSSMGGVYII
jgi:hypothetical protein